MKDYTYISLQNEEVRAHIKNTFFTKPVFMITGLKIVHRLSVDTVTTSAYGNEGQLGMCFTSVGGPMQARPEAKYIVTTKKIQGLEEVITESLPLRL